MRLRKRCGGGDRSGFNPAVDVCAVTDDVPVVIDEAFVHALTALRVTPGLVGTAKLAQQGLVFPVTGGSVTIGSSLSGVVEHKGAGLSLNAKAVTVKITDLQIRYGGESSVLALVAIGSDVTGVPAFDLGEPTSPPVRAGSTAAISGVPVKVSMGLAALLNKAFKVEAFRAGLLVGTASSTLRGR